MHLPGLTLVHSTVSLPGMALPVTSVLVAAGQARILVSPGSRLSAAQLQGLAPVTDLVAPSLLHTAGMPGAAAALPTARLWGPPGAAARDPRVQWSATLGETPWPFDEEVALFPIEGMPKVREFVLLHRPSRTLLLTDLAFNLVDARGLGARIALGLFGTWRRFAVSRLYLSMVRDRGAFKRSLAPLLSAEFDHVLPSHGAPIFNEGKARLHAALAERGLVD